MFMHLPNESHFYDASCVGADGARKFELHSPLSVHSTYSSSSFLRAAIVSSPDGKTIVKKVLTNITQNNQCEGTNPQTGARLKGSFTKLREHYQASKRVWRRSQMRFAGPPATRIRRRYRRKSAMNWIFWVYKLPKGCGWSSSSGSAEHSNWTWDKRQRIENGEVGYFPHWLFAKLSAPNQDKVLKQRSPSHGKANRLSCRGNSRQMFKRNIGSNAERPALLHNETNRLRYRRNLE